MIKNTVFFSNPLLVIGLSACFFTVLYASNSLVINLPVVLLILYTFSTLDIIIITEIGVKVIYPIYFTKCFYLFEDCIKVHIDDYNLSGDSLCFFFRKRGWLFRKKIIVDWNSNFKKLEDVIAIVSKHDHIEVINKSDKYREFLKKKAGEKQGG